MNAPRRSAPGDGITTITVSSTAGVTVQAHHLGGDGEPLIVCHATGFHGRCYVPMVAGLTPRYQVWALDMRGHGGSSDPVDGDFDWAGMRDDVLAVLDHLGIERVKAFGHSMGGCAVLLAALARPELVIAAYLYEPIVLPPGMRIDPKQNTLSASARRRRETFASREEALMRYATRPGLSVLRADALAAYVNWGFVDEPDGTVRLACSGEAEARTFEANSKLFADQLSPITAPVTIAAGRSEPVGGPALFAPAAATALGSGDLVEYRHLGHFGPLQDPDFVAGEVLRVLGVTSGA